MTDIEPDEATRIWREMATCGRRLGFEDVLEYQNGKWDNQAEISYLRTALSELIASKDAEIERRIEELFDWEKIAKRTKEALTGAEDELRVCYSELATLRAENEQLNVAIKRVQGAAKTIMHHEGEDLARLRKQEQEHYFAIRTLDSEREVNSMLTDEIERLRAENERLKKLSYGLRVYMYDKDASRREWVVKKYKASERNTAEPEPFAVEFDKVRTERAGKDRR